MGKGGFYGNVFRIKPPFLFFNNDDMMVATAIMAVMATMVMIIRCNSDKAGDQDD